MATSGPSPTQEVWFKFLSDVTIARNYKAIAVTTQPWVPESPNLILEALLPSLLYMRVGSILDEALAEVIDAKGLTIGKPYKDDFNGRINFLSNQGVLNDTPMAHDIRKRRNQLAHEPEASCDWSELDQAIDSAHSELQHLGLVGPRPNYSFFLERRPRSFSFNPTRIVQDYCYGLKEDDQVVVEVTWSYEFRAPTIKPPE